MIVFLAGGFMLWRGESRYTERMEYGGVALIVVVVILVLGFGR